MKPASEVSAAKLRGGFYSPAQLVQLCLDRVHALLGDACELEVLEPSAGDGAFVRGLCHHPLAAQVRQLTAIELVAAEAASCTQEVRDAPFPGEVRHESALAWAARVRRRYDVAVGNPPFVRFQLVAGTERRHAEQLAARIGVQLGGVSNLWLPIFLAALEKLRPGGAFAFIVPAESFTGVSGHQLRDWLLQHVQTLQIDLFPPGSFPMVLQEVVVLSGRMTAAGEVGTGDLAICEHLPSGTRRWTHRRVTGARTWTRYLLSPAQLTVLDEALQLPGVAALEEVARFEVATVTGANSYFCVDDQTVRRHRLRRWAHPLLPRTRHAPGLRYTAKDHEAVRRLGLSAHLLHFAADHPDPQRHSGARTYLDVGEQLQLPARYKCRIREPWYRVPVVPPGALLLAKRSHRYPRVIVNEASVLTTDTIYRGRLHAGVDLSPQAFTAAFHNSLTLLTAEIEGRSFGGGVLELVPSEVSRLAVPVSPEMAGEFEELDRICRRDAASEALVETTDAFVAKHTPLGAGLLAQLAGARRQLLELRLARG